MLESVFLRGGRLDAESQQTSVPQREKKSRSADNVFGQRFPNPNNKGTSFHYLTRVEFLGTVSGGGQLPRGLHSLETAGETMYSISSRSSASRYPTQFRSKKRHARNSESGPACRPAAIKDPSAAEVVLSV